MNSINTIQIQNTTDSKSAYSKVNTSKNCFSCAIEKLLSNTSNKLGLSMAIYHK